MLHFSHSAPYCYRLQLVAWYPLLSISLQERKYTHHISHIDQVIECTRIARPRVCIPPSTHPASSKRTLYLVCVFYPFLFPFFVIIVVAIDKTNAKLLKQRVSDSGLDLPSQKKTRRAVRSRTTPDYSFELACIHLYSPISSAHLHTSLTPT